MPFWQVRLYLRQAGQLAAQQQIRDIDVEMFTQLSGSSGTPQQRAERGKQLRQQRLRTLQRQAGLLPDDVEVDDLGRQVVSLSELKALVSGINDGEGRRRRKRKRA